MCNTPEGLMIIAGHSERKSGRPSPSKPPDGCRYKSDLPAINIGTAGLAKFGGQRVASSTTAVAVDS